MAPHVATATAPLAGPLPTGFCDATLTPLAEFVQALGYSISFDGSGFSATRGTSDLRCICIEGQVVIELAERDAIVSVTLTRERERLELEIAAQFPGLGSIQHTSFLDGTTGLSAGSRTFAAETADAAAFIELDLAGRAVAVDGDAALVNSRFAPVLAASTAWKDAHALALALADMPAPDLDPAVAVPSPR
ncbi:hypothetical protein [Nannocystis radixulma]|uniref:Copper amine oxidase-like N-terminal domain-containing protein n=1 Tax=Nannocystis radixulma TaxID=2995305 RepID=A0ABT5B447_9BACT|nr:hypothetical protein [Nannocystis radixulma]MDC0668243.1 hypothetical protein [Nannocystis radixulma]